MCSAIRAKSRWLIPLEGMAPRCAHPPSRSFETRMHQANPSILSVATTTPPHRIPQPVAKDFARAMFSDVYRDIDRLLPIFDHSGVENRNFCVPAEWFYEAHSFSDQHDLYVESALDLSEKAARRALDKAGADSSDVAAVFFVSTTGLAIPSIDSFLLRRLGLSEHTRRVPVVGLGCAAGASGLGRAAAMAGARRRGGARRPA